MPPRCELTVAVLVSFSQIFSRLNSLRRAAPVRPSEINKRLVAPVKTAANVRKARIAEFYDDSGGHVDLISWPYAPIDLP